MRAPFLLLLCVLPFGVLTPILEIGPTHVLNPHWPGHARLHEVWQLATNSALALLCVWLAWRRNDPGLAAAIALIVTGGFLVAFGLKPFYGGTMQHSDGSEIAILGFNIAVVIMALTAIGLVGLLVAKGRSARSAEHPSP